jgi:hypothetical protein
MGNYNYTTVNLNPYLTFKGKAWNVRLGAKAGMQLSGINKIVFSPDFRFNWRPADPILLYLTADGGITDNSAYNTFYENRYLNPLYRIYDSRSPVDGTLGIAFSPADDVSVNLFGGYKWVKDEHFYFTDSGFSYELPGQKTLPHYADAESFRLGGLVKYRYRDIFDFSMKLIFNQWYIIKTSETINSHWSTERVAWNKPVFTGDWNIGYKIPALHFRIDLISHLETGRKTLYRNENIFMKDIHDVSTVATFTINKSLSVFAKANNILFQKYDFWYGYPGQGFNLMLGFNLKF